MHLRHLAKASAGLFLTLTTIAAATAAGDLGPGSPAPKLQIKTWLKGTPVAKMDPKKTYVVEFWATWCGPCIESIPHVSQLAKENNDVTFLGVGIWEDEEGDKLPKFVERMGDKMSYNVGYSGNRKGMSATWMDAAAQNGIPTAFIVKDRKIMWIGHPMEMDEPLQKIKTGKFDLVAFKASFDKQALETRKQMAKYKEYDDVTKLHDSGKNAEAKAALVKLVAKYPDLAETAERARYNWLADEDPAAWETQTKALLETGKTEDLQKVAGFSLSRAQKPAGAEKARKAMAMVVKANANDDFLILKYARSVYLKLGDTKEALEVTNKMLEVQPKTPEKDNAELKKTLLDSKAELEAKLAKA